MPDSAATVKRGPVERTLIYALLAVALVLFLFPFYWLATAAFKTQGEIFNETPQLIPTHPILTNFGDIGRYTRIGRAFFNTTLIAVVHVTLALFLSSLAGFAFAVYRKAAGNKLLFALVLGTMTIPGAVTLIPVYVLLEKLHLANTYWGMILPGAATAFGIFWMRQYIATNVPDDLLAAARIDGCGEFGLYWRIVLPVIRPALGALGVLILIGNWNNLMWAFIVLRTPNMQTLPLLIYYLQGERETPYGMLMAGGLLATLPLVAAFLLFQRSFISGMTAGAVKN